MALRRDSIAFSSENSVEDDFVLCDSFIFEWKKITEKGVSYFVCEYKPEKFSQEEVHKLIQDRYDIHPAAIHIIFSKPSVALIKIPFEIGRKKITATAACAEEVNISSGSGLFGLFNKKTEEEKKALSPCAPRFDLTKALRGTGYLGQGKQGRISYEIDESFKSLIKNHEWTIVHSVLGFGVDKDKLNFFHFCELLENDSVPQTFASYQALLIAIVIHNVQDCLKTIMNEISYGRVQKNNIAILDCLKVIEDHFRVGLELLHSLHKRFAKKMEESQASELLIKAIDWVHEQQQKVAVYADVVVYQAKIPKITYDAMTKESAAYYPGGLPAHVCLAAATCAITVGYGLVLASTFSAHPIASTLVHARTRGALFKPLKALPQASVAMLSTYGYACRKNISPEWIEGDILLRNFGVGPAVISQRNPNYKENKEETVTCYFLHSGHAQTLFESFKPSIGFCGSKITAAAMTGPAKGPRPASSTPAIR